MKKAYFLMSVFFLCFIGFLYSYEVAEEELKVADEGNIEFINYTGPYDVVRTLDEIFGIGKNLGTQEGTQRQVEDQFFIIHAVGPEEEDGFDADIFVLGPEGYVDHIKNVRRILAGYLEEAYKYAREDALLLAKFITFYNAVHRGDGEFIQQRYKRIVFNNLIPEKIGLARTYHEWPGKTMMVIPLTRRAEEGGLGSLDSDELSDEEVIEDLQEEEDRGVEDRKELVELKEREIEEEAKDIEEERRDIEASEESAEEQTAEEETEVEEEPTVEERSEELEEREQRLEERRQNLEEERESIAEDQQLVIEDEERRESEDTPLSPQVTTEDQAEPEGPDEDGTPFLVTMSSGYAMLTKVDFATGTFMIKSDIDTILGRKVYPLGNVFLVVFEDTDNGNSTAGVKPGKLGLIEKKDLQAIQIGTETVYEDTYILIEGSSIFAVVRSDNGWYLGRFDQNLTLQNTSSKKVAPYTVFVVEGNYIYAQDASDTITAFDKETLE